MSSIEVFPINEIQSIDKVDHPQSCIVDLIYIRKREQIILFVILSMGLVNLFDIQISIITKDVKQYHRLYNILQTYIPLAL
jgi:hypothetical protein